MNGLSSGALQNTTSFAQPIEPLSFVSSAVLTIVSPRSLTASMSIPVLVEPTLTELQTLSVEARASGMDSISSFSAGVIPFETRAEKPPMKLTFISCAARSSVLAILTKSAVSLQHDAPIREIGVTETRLLTIGIPNSSAISSPVLTSLPAFASIFL